MAGSALAEPKVFWASDPVQPDDTVLVTGDDLAGVGSVRIGRLTDNPVGPPAITETIEVPTVQPSPSSFKFIVPKQLGAGVFRVSFADATAKSFDLNAPSIYWLQGDQGHASSPGGWLRAFGRNIARAPGARLVLAKVGGPESVTLTPTRFSLWEAAFTVPADLPPGAYKARLWNGHGDASAWRDAGVWQIHAKPEWPPLTLNVKQFGAGGDGVRDDVGAVRAGLQALADQGGGTLWFPRGYYRLNEGLSLPAGVRLKGEDRGLVRLIWPDFVNPPHALIEGRSDFAIEDLTLMASNHGHIISGGFEAGSDSAVSEAKNISIRRVTIRASMYRGRQSIDDSIKRMVAEFKFVPNGPDTLRLSGSNLTVEDSDLYGSGRSLYLNRPTATYIARNKLYNGRWGWYSISGADGVIFEDNQVTGADLLSTGGGVNTLFRVEPFAQNVAFIHNRFEMMHGWDREAMTSDGPGGCYFGGIASIGDNGRTALLPETAPGELRDLKRCVGAGVFIMGGRGLGQVRRVEAIDGNSLRLDRRFDIDPDSTSVLTVTSFQRNYLMIGNGFSDAGIAIQFYGSAVGHVVAENVSVRTGGFLNRGLQYHAYQPSWYTQFIDNQIREGDLGREALIATWGSQKPPNTAPLSMATVIRGNRLEGNAHIEVRGTSKSAHGVQDVVIEHNTISHAATGIIVDEGSTGVLLRNNSFDDVAMPLINKSGERLQ